MTSRPIPDSSVVWTRFKLPGRGLLPHNRRSFKKTALGWSLLVSRTRTNFDDIAFNAAGPRVWNYLETDLRQPDLYTVSDIRWRYFYSAKYIFRENSRTAVD